MSRSPPAIAHRGACNAVHKLCPLLACSKGWNVRDEEARPQRAEVAAWSRHGRSLTRFNMTCFNRLHPPARRHRWRTSRARKG